MTQAELVIIKIGGSVVNEKAELHPFLEAFAKISQHKILVHGGGVLAKELCEKLAIPVHMIEGRRVTDKATLDVVTMVYGGLINKQIVAKLNSLGCSALGLTGADGGLIKAHKRKVLQHDFGYVGDIDQVNVEVLQGFLAKNLCPVIAPLTFDGSGQLLNTNADTIASELCRALASHYKTSLIFTMDLAGVLRNPKDPATLIRSLNPQNVKELAEAGIISEGMLPKLENGMRAKAAGASCVRICNAMGSIAVSQGEGAHGTELVSS